MPDRSNWLQLWVIVCDLNASMTLSVILICFCYSKKYGSGWFVQLYLLCASLITLVPRDCLVLVMLLILKIVTYCCDTAAFGIVPSLTAETHCKKYNFYSTQDAAYLCLDPTIIFLQSPLKWFEYLIKFPLFYHVTHMCEKNLLFWTQCNWSYEF